ncbi:MAG: NEW3 domain-containing protein [Solirubrobacteraceae bacterium]
MGTSLVLAGASAASAAAADLPIAVTFPGGTVTAGNLPEAAATSPSTLTGTISTDTLAASFPDVTLSDARRADVDFGALVGSGDLTIKADPGTFTGSFNLLGGTYDLSGPVTYTVTGTIKSGLMVGEHACTIQAIGNLTVAGVPDLATGAYAVDGSRPNVLPTPVNPTDLLGDVAFCAQLGLTKILPAVTSTTTKYAGSISIPGLVPPPDVVVPAPTPTTPAPTPTIPAPTPTTPARTPAPKAAQLSLTLDKPKRVRRGKQTRLTIKLSNTGTARARSVRVTVRRPSRTRVSRKTIRFSSLPAGRTRTIRVWVRTTKRTKARARMSVKATASGGLSVTRNRTIRTTARR